ncbi:MAG TPA: hypothetical protein VJ066_02770 [Candidatus Bathyarchaeia archaeon]|nr:hypothetical protein [Candidatus Bathyarchaeia archaeon]
MTLAQKEKIEALRADWKRLWQERVDDRVRAEGIAITDYSSLFVEQGTIIHATRDFKVLNFKDILEKHKVENAERFIQPSPQIGGWNKFVKTEITSQNRIRNSRARSYLEEKKVVQQPKKGGRGWLHL